MLGPSAKGVQRMDCVSEVREGNFKVVGDKLPHKFLWEKTLKLPLFLHLSFFYMVMPHVLWKKYWKWVNKKNSFWCSKSFFSKENHLILHFYLSLLDFGVNIVLLLTVSFHTGVGRFAQKTRHELFESVISLLFTPTNFLVWIVM